MSLAALNFFIDYLFLSLIMKYLLYYKKLNTKREPREADAGLSALPQPVIVKAITAIINITDAFILFFIKPFSFTTLAEA